MENKKKLTLGITLVLIILLITIGISYAYFSANITGGEKDTTITVIGGTMNIHYAGGANITAHNIKPDNNAFATKTFTVTGNNTTDLEMFYEVKLVVEENTFSEEALKYNLSGINTDNNGFLIGDITEFTNIGSGAKSLSLGVGGYDLPTGGNKIHTYNLELYFPETNINQNIDQGKIFKAHVEIKGANKPDPCKEGNCLKDLIIAQGGGADNIAAKGTPDFNVIAPALLTYKELTSTYTSSLSSSSNRAIGTGYTFNEITGNYTLTNYQINQTYRQEHIGQYTCASQYFSDCSTMYLINELTGTTITSSIRYQKEVNKYNLTDTDTGTGLYATEDDYGTSYYYRGNKETLNNNLIWAGLQWKIVRINGDGSIRIVYNGTEAQFESNKTMNSTGSSTQIGKSVWNQTHYDDAKYVGYMYGGANGVASTIRNGTTSLAATFNETDTSIKTTIDNWYKTNIVDKSYSDIVADNLFCNDRQLQSEVGGTATGTGYGGSTITVTHYAAYHRLYTNKTPTLKCGLKNDRFTVNDTTLGNGALTYPVGLLTADETSFAGLRYNTSNDSNYLYTWNWYWLFSPYGRNSSSVALAMVVNGVGYKRDAAVWETYGVRPAVSLSASAIATGSGSATDPFRV